MRKEHRVLLLSFAMTAFSGILWSLNVVSTEFDILRIHSVLNYVGMLPYGILGGLSVLAFAAALLWLNPSDNRSLGRLGLLQVAILTCVLWGTPILVGGIGTNQNFGVPLLHFGDVEYIIRHGHLDPASLIQHDWPGFHVAMSVLFQVFGIPPDPNLLIVIELSPLVFQLLYLVSFYCLARHVTDARTRNTYWAGLWLFNLANWSNTTYFSGQSMAFLLLLTLQIVLARAMVGRFEKRPGQMVPMIIIMAALTLTHGLTSLLALLFLLLSAVVSKKTQALNIVLISCTLIGSWNLFNFASLHVAESSAYISRLLRPDVMLSKIALFSNLAGETPKTVGALQVVCELWLVLLASAGVILSMRGRKTTGDRLMLASGMSAVMIGLIMGAGYAGGRDILRRVPFFLVPSVAYFGAKLVNVKRMRVVLLVSLPCLATLFFMLHYGGVVGYYQPPGYLAGSAFLSDNSDGGTLIRITPFGEPIWRNKERYPFFPYSLDYVFERTGDVAKAFRSINARIEGADSYLFMGVHEELYFEDTYDLQLSGLKLLVYDDPAYCLVYNSGEAKLLVHE